MQHTPGIDQDSFWTKEMHPTGPEYEVSEDSLYLNIFTPAWDENAMLPVLFYIHGGGFTGGYPSEIEFDWEHMAKKGMVVVSIQYRLGTFGFLASSALSDVHREEGKGNYGIEDTVYLYEFDGDIPGEDHIGSYHGSEMWFAYDALSRCDRPFTGKHYDLA